MGKYVYIDKDSSKGRFGIGVGVFQVLADEALTRIPGLVTDPVQSPHRHKLYLNNAEVRIHRGVVYLKISVNAKNTIDVAKLKKNIIEEVNSSFMMIAEQIPVEVKVNVESVI